MGRQTETAMPQQPIVPWNHNSTVVESASISGDDSPHGLVFYVPEGDAMQAGFIGDTCFSATFPCVSEAGRLDVRTAGYQLHEWMHTESRHQPFNDFAICFVVDLDTDEMRADCISLAHRLGAIDYQIINSCTAGMIDSGSTSGIVIDIGSERTICSGFVEGFNMLLFSDKHSAMWKHSYVCANEVEQVADVVAEFLVELPEAEFKKLHTGPFAQPVDLDALRQNVIIVGGNTHGGAQPYIKQGQVPVARSAHYQANPNASGATAHHIQAPEWQKGEEVSSSEHPYQAQLWQSHPGACPDALCCLACCCCAWGSGVHQI